MSALGGRRIVVVVAALAALGAIGWGGAAWYASLTRVATDDAYVDELSGNAALNGVPVTVEPAAADSMAPVGADAAAGQ